MRFVQRGKKAHEVDEGCSTSRKKTVEEMRDSLAKARDEILQLKKDYKKKFLVKKVRSYSLKAQGDWSAESIDGKRRATSYNTFKWENDAGGRKDAECTAT